jgi:predicted DNA-binding ribbon-helix-helix protein
MHLQFDAKFCNMHHISKFVSNMRTTITLENDAFAVAQAYAQARALKLGQAVSELIRRGHGERLAIRQQGSVWVFDLPVKVPRVSAARVKELLDETE